MLPSCWTEIVWPSAINVAVTSSAFFVPSLFTRYWNLVEKPVVDPPGENIVGVTSGPSFLALTELCLSLLSGVASFAAVIIARMV